MFRILVAEDDAALNKMICDKLSREGYIVSPAFDGEEALRVMEREHIDLVLTAPTVKPVGAVRTKV